jgi:hypothetical protein
MLARSTPRNMKKILLSMAVAASAVAAQAQFQVNPQVGLTFQNLTNTPTSTTSKSAVGWQLGSDFRFGDRFFLQPGAFLSRNATVVTNTVNTGTGTAGSVEIEDNLIRTNLTLRAMAGYRIIDSYQFDLRFMLGSSYDILLSVDNKNDKIDWNKGDFNSGSFNIDMGLGFDMGLITLAPMASFGITNVFNDNANVKDIDSKYITYGLTLGINLGNDD